MVYDDEEIKKIHLDAAGGAFVIEGQENEGLVEEYNTFDEADRERLRIERKLGVLVAVVDSSRDKA